MCLWFHGVASVDYKTALVNSLLYYEAQRSGSLPTNQRVQWRGNSGLKDGKDAGVDLVGGYYDAGDNVKFGFPMAFTITMLSWGVVDFYGRFSETDQLSNALEAIKWGTDYLMKAHTQSDVLYGQVGDGDSDHPCWQRPEDMTTPRTAFKIDKEHPGADLAGETAAALAAASIAFNATDPAYASQLREHAVQLWAFAHDHPGHYQDSIPGAGKFYSSTEFKQDELLWGAAWLFRATHNRDYVDFLDDALNSGGIGGTRTVFSWDDKYLGSQVVVAKLILDGTFADQQGKLDGYKDRAEEFICSCIQKGSNNIKRTPGGLLWWQPWNNLQYTTAATFVVTVYSDFLAAAKASIKCPGGVVQPSDLIAFVQTQVDYILGVNPKKMSYMVGFGTNYPSQIHHRAASIVSIKKDPTPVTCQGGFDSWFNKNGPNPNVVSGAIVGGPDDNDAYTDSRSNYQQAEPATANTAPLVGVLARFV
ncbi:hypothetical protein L1049_018718 [Liquidambar formosana]|uniref:Endoglucanase n=1 Tax=Liquidambar formosana TaxID=63359 RepID=A0AAP0RAG5_LIQFO